jgi:hypothetical protein
MINFQFNKTTLNQVLRSEVQDIDLVVLDSEKVITTGSVSILEEAFAIRLGPPINHIIFMIINPNNVVFLDNFDNIENFSHKNMSENVMISQVSRDCKHSLTDLSIETIEQISKGLYNSYLTILDFKAPNNSQPLLITPDD